MKKQLSREAQIKKANPNLIEQELEKSLFDVPVIDKKAGR